MDILYGMDRNLSSINNGQKMLDGVLSTREIAVLRKITTKIEKILHLMRKFSLSWKEELNY